MSTLSRYRGDTVSFGITVTQDGAAYDLTGCILTMTINSDQDPVDISNQMQQTIATINADPTTGEATFEFTGTDFDFSPGTYYYDIELTDASSKKKTLIKDKVKIIQDITK